MYIKLTCGHHAREIIVSVILIVRKSPLEVFAATEYSLSENTYPHQANKSIF